MIRGYLMRISTRIRVLSCCHLGAAKEPPHLKTSDGSVLCAYRLFAGRVGLHAVGLASGQLRRLAYSFRMLFFAGDALMAFPPEHLPPPT